MDNNINTNSNQTNTNNNIQTDNSKSTESNETINNNVKDPQSNSAFSESNKNVINENNLPSEKTDSQGDKSGDIKQANKAPEIYKDFIMPEGFTIDKDLNSEFRTLAKDFNLSQDQAQKLVDLQCKSLLALRDAPLKKYEETTEEWKKETIQSLGHDSEKKLSLADKALETFGSPELKELLIESGFIHNKHVVNHFLNIGQKISEDGFLGGKRPSDEVDPLAKLYPSMKK